MVSLCCPLVKWSKIWDDDCCQLFLIIRNANKHYAIVHLWKLTYNISLDPHHRQTIHENTMELMKYFISLSELYIFGWHIPFFEPDYSSSSPDECMYCACSKNWIGLDCMLKAKSLLTFSLSGHLSSELKNIVHIKLWLILRTSL